MARFGTPAEGVDNILINAYTGLYLVLYTNTANSLDSDTVFADLTQPSAVDGAAEANGYGAVSLTGTWSSTSRVISYDHGTPNSVVYTNSGTQDSWDLVVGSAITDLTYILHFKDFSTALALPLGATLNVDISSLVV